MIALMATLTPTSTIARQSPAVVSHAVTNDGSTGGKYTTVWPTRPNQVATNVMVASTSGAARNGIVRLGFITSGTPKMSISLTFHRLGTSDAKASLRSRATRDRSMSNESDSVAPDPPVK